MKSLAILLLCICIFVAPIKGADLVVDVTNSGSNNTYSSIQNALFDSNEGDKIILNGTVFFGLDNVNVDLSPYIGNRTFVGPSIIDCQNGSRAFYVIDQSFFSNTTVNTFRFEDISFINCFANVFNYSNNGTDTLIPAYGGAIYIKSNLTRLELYNVSFDNNQAERGHAIYYDGSTPNSNAMDGEIIIKAGTFTNNGGFNDTIDTYGTIYTRYTSIVASNVTFTDNTATYGTAIFGSVRTECNLTSFVMNNNVVLETGVIDLRVRSRLNGKSVFFLNNTGTGLFLEQSQAIFGDDSTFHKNRAEGAAGGAFLDGSSITMNGGSFSENEDSLMAGALYLGRNSYGLFTNTLFSSNTGGDGGVAAVISSSKLFIQRSTITGNSARRGGVVFTNYQSQVTVSDSDVTDNSATSAGAFYCSDSELVLANSTFAQNADESSDESVVYCATDIPLTSCQVSGDSPYTGTCTMVEPKKGLRQAYQILIGVLVAFVALVILAVLFVVLWKKVNIIRREKGITHAKQEDDDL